MRTECGTIYVGNDTVKRTGYGRITDCYDRIRCGLRTILINGYKTAYRSRNIPVMRTEYGRITKCYDDGIRNGIRKYGLLW